MTIETFNKAPVARLPKALIYSHQNHWHFTVANHIKLLLQNMATSLPRRQDLLGQMWKYAG
jgi:hypothetical protein